MPLEGLAFVGEFLDTLTGGDVFKDQRQAIQAKQVQRLILARTLRIQQAEGANTRLAPLETIYATRTEALAFGQGVAGALSSVVECLGSGKLTESAADACLRETVRASAFVKSAIARLDAARSTLAGEIARVPPPSEYSQVRAMLLETLAQVERSLVAAATVREPLAEAHRRLTIGSIERRREIARQAISRAEAEGQRSAYCELAPSRLLRQLSSDRARLALAIAMHDVHLVRRAAAYLTVANAEFAVAAVACDLNLDERERWAANVKDAERVRDDALNRRAEHMEFLCARLLGPTGDAVPSLVMPCSEKVHSEDFEFALHAYLHSAIMSNQLTQE